jgi:hypothetical protein
MKAVFALCLVLAAAAAPAGEPPASASPAVVKGVVQEVKEAPGFTYLRLKTRDGETWAAVRTATVKPGAEVTIENVVVMRDFESKSLKRKFETIVLGDLAGAGAGARGGGNAAASPHAGPAGAASVGDVQVPKASGPNARSVAEIMTRGAELKGKPVVVRGKVVKYNPGIMGRNWIHLRDGSGSAADGTNDVLVTSTNDVKLGDVVTMRGTVRTDADFGSGYSYKVLVEEATLQK